MQITINDVNKLTDLERQILNLLVGGETCVDSHMQKISIADMPDTGKTIETSALPKQFFNTDANTPESLDPNVAFGSGGAHSIAAVVPSPIAPIISALPNVSLPIAAPFNTLAPVQTVITPLADATHSNLAQGDTDKNGFPWHADIHSSSKEKNQDGSWRYKRGADKSVIQAVEAQLRAALAAPAQPAPQAPLTTLDLNVLTWPVLIQELTGLLSTNKITNDQITKICKESGVEQFSMLAARPDLFKNVLFRCQQLASVA